MTIVETINQGIKDAMKSKELVRLDTLRMLKSKILAADARGNIPDEKIFQLFRTYLGNLQESLVQFQSAGRAEMTEKLSQEILIIQEFLPKMPSLEETKELVRKAIGASGAKTKKELGLVMKALMQSGVTLDGKVARDLASDMLPDA